MWWTLQPVHANPFGFFQGVVSFHRKRTSRFWHKAFTISKHVRGTISLNQRLKYPYEFIGDILITQDQIEERVAEIGAQITEDYKDSEKLLLLGLLRGSVMFMTDLMRNVRRPMTMDFMLVSSYAGTESSGFVRIDSDHKSSIAGWDVIMVDDIVDTGLTLHTVRKLLLDRHPRSSESLHAFG